MIRYKLIYSRKALKNLSEIHGFIKKRESIERAEYVVLSIVESARNVAIYPAKHRIEPTFNRPNIRFAIKWCYKIVFQITGDTIRILSIFHTAQSPGKLRNYKP